MPCKRLFYFETAALSPLYTVLIADAHLPLWAPTRVLVLKWSAENPNFWSMPPRRSLSEDGSSFSTLESATALAPDTGMIYRIDINVWEKQHFPWIKQREGLVYPRIEYVTIILPLFSEGFWKYVISMCDYRWRKGSRKDCWWGLNYWTSREVQSNQLLTSQSEAGA